MKRCFLIIIDGLGIGAQEDASDYGDEGADTLGHICEQVGVSVPNLKSLGIGNIKPLTGIDAVAKPQASYGRMREVSAGKDSTTGHWELAGIHLEQAFPTYPDGFPEELTRRFCEATGVHGALCGKPYSGTDVIRDYGEEHIRTGYPIIYTSADSVFQIATHDAVIPVESLYEMCSITRTEVCTGEHLVGRVIARPFTGEAGDLSRLSDQRHDYSAIPPEQNLNQYLQKKGVHTVSVGKVTDLFAEKGFNESLRTRNNAEGMEELKKVIGRDTGRPEFIFANLIDTDQLFGHRLDPVGYAGSLEEFDKALPELLAGLRKGDLLIITGDHGNDPCSESTDHSREFVPLLVFSSDPSIPVTDLGTRESFSDIAVSVVDHFGLEQVFKGKSIL